MFPTLNAGDVAGWVTGGFADEQFQWFMAAFGNFTGLRWFLAVGLGVAILAHLLGMVFRGSGIAGGYQQLMGEPGPAPEINAGLYEPYSGSGYYTGGTSSGRAGRDGKPLSGHGGKRSDDFRWTGRGFYDEED